MSRIVLSPRSEAEPDSDPAIAEESRRVRDLVEERLASSSHQFLRHVCCEAEGGVVTLHGKVPSFYLKQTAQSLLRSIDEIERVDNRIVVVNPTGVSSVPD